VSFNAYARPNSKEQNYLYNGVKFNNETQLYETAFRTYDPFLRRFNHIDPLTASIPSLRPYHFGFNNPVRFNDPMGLIPIQQLLDGPPVNLSRGYTPIPMYTGSTAPGSGNHWSDGMEYSDWDPWTGSNMYRAGLANGATDLGGTLYHITGNGNRTPYVENNGQLGYYEDRGFTEYDRIDWGDGSISYMQVSGVESIFHSVGGQNRGGVVEAKYPSDKPHIF